MFTADGFTEAEIIRMLLIVCPLVFFAGFVDAIAGGGGLITLPAYMMAGLPMHMAYGTNKFSAFFGTCVSSLNYMRYKLVDWKVTLWAIPFTLIMSTIGAEIALLLSDRVLRTCVLVLLPLALLFMLFQQRKQSSKEVSQKKKTIIVVIVSSCVGFYDGFFGPGSGTFLILAFISLVSMEITKASGSAKIINLASNTAALVVFWSGGSVLYSVGIPACIFGMVGNFIGSHLAMKKTARIIKPMMVLVFIFLFITLIIDLF